MTGVQTCVSDLHIFIKFCNIKLTTVIAVQQVAPFTRYGKSARDEFTDAFPLVLVRYAEVSSGEIVEVVGELKRNWLVQMVLLIEGGLDGRGKPSVGGERSSRYRVHHAECQADQNEQGQQGHEKSSQNISCHIGLLRCRSR